MFTELSELFPEGPPTTCMSWERCAVPLQGRISAALGALGPARAQGPDKVPEAQRAPGPGPGAVVTKLSNRSHMAPEIRSKFDLPLSTA